MGKEADLNNDHMELLEWKIESLKIESMKNMNKRVRREEGGMRMLSKLLKRTPEWETRENMRQYLKYIHHQIEKAQALSRIIKNKSTPIKITPRGWNTKDKMIDVTTENIREQNLSDEGLSTASKTRSQWYNTFEVPRQMNYQLRIL